MPHQRLVHEHMLALPFTLLARARCNTINKIGLKRKPGAMAVARGVVVWVLENVRRGE